MIIIITIKILYLRAIDVFLNNARVVCGFNISLTLTTRTKRSCRQHLTNVGNFRFSIVRQCWTLLRLKQTSLFAGNVVYMVALF